MKPLRLRVLIEIGWYTYLLEQSPWNLLESCFQVCPD